MRLGTYPRAERLLGRLPRLTAYSAIELVLLALIAIQAARLVWTLVTPLAPLGDYRSTSALAAPPAGAGALGDFDPFFRLSGADAPASVTSLNLKLYGVREDRATGRGSAIIALPDGNQRSFAVGEEVMPGVTLAEVGFDSVTISRSGAREQIFLDQPQSAPPAAAAPADQGSVAPSAPVAPSVAQRVASPVVAPAPPASGAAIRFQPRMGSSQIDGIAVSAGADGGRALRAAGFEPGDVIVSINGQRVTSMEQTRALLRSSSGHADVMVNRGGRAVALRVRLNP